MSSAAHFRRCTRALAAVILTAIGLGIASPVNSVAASSVAISQFTDVAALRPMSTAGDVQAYINAYRRRVGAAPVTLEWRLNTAAQRHAVEMGSRRLMTHTGANGSNAGQRISLTGYRWWIWGENVAAGQTTASQVVWSWLNSPSHRAIMLDRRYRNVGLGWYKGSNGVIYWCLLFGSLM